MMLAVFALASCQDNDEENFGNKASINSQEMRAETIIKGNSGDVLRHSASPCLVPPRRPLTLPSM